MGKYSRGWFLLRRSRQLYVKITFVFLVFLMQWQQKKNLAAKRKEISETLTIYRQMDSYSKTACKVKPTEENLVIRHAVVDVDLAMIQKEVTFIVLSQSDMDCTSSRLEKLKERYPTVNVVLAFESIRKDLFKTNIALFPVLKNVVNLGGFKSFPEALQNAILVVRTKYFMLLDTQLAIDELQMRFVQKLVANIHGFDVLGGSLIDTKEEFNIPCHGLKLRNWTFFESFEYHVVGNALQCESTSPYFLANTESFKDEMVLKQFDVNVGIMWRKDFFLSVKGLLAVGTLPEVIFKNTITFSCPEKATTTNDTRKLIDALLPFVNKHHVFDFINPDGNRTTICDGSDPMICSEKYIFPQWKLRHWAFSGLTAFPFIVERLIDALRFGTSELEKAGIKYSLEGGTLLGFVKVQQVLPWDSGDVDTFVFSSRRTIIKLVKQVEREQGYEYLLRWNAFHVYVTPYLAAHDGLIVYAKARNEPEELIKIRMHGALFPAPRTMFKFIREHYGSSYLESRIRFGDERVSCDYDGYQACMPDCRWDGCGSGRGQFPGILT